MKDRKYYYLLIAFSAILWALVGIFVEVLREAGFNSLEIVAIRALMAVLIFIAYSLKVDSSLLKVELKDLKYFFGTGVLSVVFFNWCYFTAIKEVSLSVAVVLLYTAPAFVTVISLFVFGEKITKDKVLALFILLVGCSLTVGLLPGKNTSFSTFGLLVGLGSGLGYALYSIFGKLASAKYRPLTITTYTFIMASVVILPLSQIWLKASLFLQGKVVLYSIALGLFPTSLAYILYTIGLTKVEAGRASIIANIEPVVAVLIGVIFMDDILTFWQVVGALLVLAAAFLIQKGKN